MDSLDRYNIKLFIVIMLYAVMPVQGVSSNSAVAATAVGLLITVTMTISIIMMVLLCAQKKSRPRPKIVNGSPPIPLNVAPRSSAYEEIKLQTLIHQHIPDRFSFPRENLTFVGGLGVGQYGVVGLADALGLSNQGQWIKTKVAIKTVKADAKTKDKIEFLRELEVMKQLKPHRNVLGLLGCCIEKEPFLIMVEFMPNGNLLQYLEKNRLPNIYPNSIRRPSQSTITPMNLLMMAKQVADGMAHLARNQCIHRDLAARNVLVGADFLCKVSDFGRAYMGACVIDKHIKNKGPLPLRWMAIESMVDSIHSSSTDVWSFGILLWEIATLGARPYAEMLPKQIIQFLQQGYRMPKPQHCSEEVYDIMMACWSTDPARRPTFTQLSEDIARVLALDSKDYVVIERIDKRLYDDRTFVDPFEELEV